MSAARPLSVSAYAPALAHRGVDMLLQELEPPILERALERAIVFIHRQREAIPAVDALRHVVHSPSCRNEQRGGETRSRGGVG